MSRIVPSQVVTAIGHLFPQVHSGGDFNLHRGNRPQMVTLLGLIDHIPPELMPRDPNDFVKLIIGLNFLRGVSDQGATLDESFSRVPGGDRNVICDIYDILNRCSDEAPAPGTTDLLFISDPLFREGLRVDISTANQALANGEWKAATVLAGSVVEALLLWVLQPQSESALQQALATARSKDPNLSQPRNTLEHWTLQHYIAVAEQLQKINADTATQARLAKDFRNLIHPGKAQRQAQTCTRGTAMAALAAVEMVIECLTP